MQHSGIGRRLLSAALLLLLMAGMIIPVLAGTPTDAYVNDDEVYVRTGAGTSYSYLTCCGSNVLLYRGQYVKVISSAKGTDGCTWYQINFRYKGYSKLGYMRSDFITALSGDDAFCSYLDSQGFPDSYKPYLRALYAASGGKWTFVANKTDLTWADALEMESTLGISLVSGSNTALRATVSGSYDNGTWKQAEPGWYYASKETVAYYLDPRSYLTDGTCFAFQLPTCDGSATVADVKSTLSGCAWASDAICKEFIRAGQEANVDPIYLAVKAKNEIGTGSTKNALGYEVSGTKYYNFFNVGAYVHTRSDYSGSDPNYYGILHAKDMGWDTSYKAILGGAKFIYENYISAGQSTQYLQRFNLTSTNTYVHQYATDVAYAYKGGWGVYKSYDSSDLLTAKMTFSIPIFKKMPAVTKLPYTSTESEYTPAEESGGSTTTPVTTYDYIAKLGLTLNSSYVSGFSVGTPASSLTAQIQTVNSAAAVTVKTASGAAVSASSPIATGDVLTITDAAGTKTYTCVVYGDVNGDGRIAATDLLAVKKHILKTATLSGAYAKAASIKNNQIAATSLLAIKKHILGTATIAQK